MKKKTSILLIALAFLIAIATIGGTMAWLSKKSSVTNTFTVGSIVVPTTDPTDNSVIIDIDGNVYEPSWDDEAEHKLMPSATFEKDPYVGIGKGSEDAAVYVYVENTLSNKVYFDINEGWEAVEATSGSKAGSYTSGLFKYTAGLTGSSTGDTWTTKPLFSSVEVADDASDEDFTDDGKGNYNIIVNAFIHQANDSEGNAIDNATILAAAKDAFNIQ